MLAQTNQRPTESAVLGSATLAAPRTAAGSTGQPGASQLPPVELRQPAGSATGKPTVSNSVGAHDPSTSPVFGSRPLPRPNAEAEIGSNGREHAQTPQPANGGSFSLTETANQAAQQPAIAAQPIAASQPISQPTAAPSTTPGRPTADQLPVSHQLAGPVLSLRTAGNGSHQLTIALHPAELGPVNLHVRVLGDSMAIQLASTSEGARDALRDALPQLRQELQAAGLPNVDLSLDLGGAGTPSGGHAQAGGGQSPPSHRTDRPTEQPISAAPRRSTTTESGLDRWL